MWYILLIGIIIGVIYLIYCMETAPTYEEVWPGFPPECAGCNLVDCCHKCGALEDHKKKGGEI
jgi:hypothetical protein